MNRSFQTVLGTLLKVMTPLTVSRKSDQVELKSTLLGFKDMFFPSFVLKFWTKAKWNYGTEFVCLLTPNPPFFLCFTFFRQTDKEYLLWYFVSCFNLTENISSRKFRLMTNFCFLVNTQYGPKSVSSRQKGYIKKENSSKLVYFLIHFW